MISNAYKLALYVLVVFTCVGVFIPFIPILPASGLDPSYSLALNQALAQGYAFGRDIVFTYGPLSSIYTANYHPFTDKLMLAGSGYLSIIYSLAIVLIITPNNPGLIVSLIALLAGLNYSREALFLSAALCVGIASYKVASSMRNLHDRHHHAILVAVLFSAFGLLSVVKGSLIPITTGVTIIACIFFIAQGFRLCAISCVVSHITSLCIFWLVSGQSLRDLPNYIFGVASLSSGFTAAMSLHGNSYEALAYLIASMILIISMGICKSITYISRIYLIAVLLLFLFLSFKYGFVRHDAHAEVAGASILFAALISSFLHDSNLKPIVVIGALITWVYIDSHYRNSSTLTAFQKLKSTYAYVWHGMKRRAEEPGWPRRDYFLALSDIRSKQQFPHLPGTTDIYSYDQALLIASDNVWSPRPVFQSYSAYTPYLVNINRDHLLGASAPDNIFFKIQPIDERLPSLDDGPSWPILIEKYKFSRFHDEYLILEKRAIGYSVPEPHEIFSKKHTFGEKVMVPASSELVYANIVIEPTVLGGVFSVMYKADQLVINMQLESGIRKSFRLVSSLAKAGFLLTPLVENTREFSLLYGADTTTSLAGKTVKYLWVTTPDGKSHDWQNTYEITFSGNAPLPAK